VFRGSNTAKIDAKGRFKVPTDFRRVLEQEWGTRVFVTSVMGDAALFYPLAVWQRIEERLMSLPSNDRARQKYLRRVMYYGQEGELDNQGRIILQPLLREAASLDGDVVVCAAGDHLQIWNRGHFEDSLSAEEFTDQDFEALAERGI
jgi:MraZ protein